MAKKIRSKGLPCLGKGCHTVINERYNILLLAVYGVSMAKFNSA